MKRILAILLALCIVMTAFAACGNDIEGNIPIVPGTGDQNVPGVPGSPDDTPDDTPDDSSQIPDTYNGIDLGFVRDNGLEYVWNQLEEPYKTAFAGVMNCIKNVEMIYTPTVDIPYESRSDFLALVYNCSMDYTYIGTSFAAPDSNEDGFIDYIRIPYNFEVITMEPDAWALTDALNARIDEIVAGMPADASEWEQIRYLHDTLIFSCDYSEDAQLPFTAYGALVERKATCQGYADAMHLLLSHAGFDTMFAIGVGESVLVTHKWNYVKLSDGKWYILDPTWADPVDKDDPDYICYDYFMISDEVILQDHKEKHESPYYTVPVATSMELSYHEVMGYYCTSYEQAYAATVKQVRECAEQGRRYIYIRTDPDSYDEINQKLFMKDYGGELGQIIRDLNEEKDTGFTGSRWSRYSAHKDGSGPYTIIITLRDAE